MDIADRAERELRELLDTATLDVRLEVLSALGRVGGKRTLKLLYHALRTGPPDVRVRAADVLVAFGLPDAAPEVRAAMNDAADLVRVQLAGSLARLGDPSGINILESELVREGGLQLHAAIALVAVRPNEKARRLLRSVANGPAGGARWRRAMAALVRSGDTTVLFKLRGELSRPEYTRAIPAAKILASAGDPDALAYLARVTANERVSSRGRAALALAETSGKSAADVVADSTAHELDALEYVRETLADADARDRHLAIATAGRLAGRGGERFFDDIVQAMDKGNDSIIRITARAAVLALAPIISNQEETR